MEPIHWHNSFSVGVQKIDAQHKRLFALINNLIQAVNTNQQAEEFDRILHSVLDYTENHFRTEEELFKIHPQWQGHCIQHQQLIDHTLRLRSGAQGDHFGAATTLLDFLTRWLQDHILKTDISFFSDLGYRPRETREDLKDRLQQLAHKERILIAEDSPVERLLLRRNLEQDGYEVLEATNGDQALQLLDEHFDVHLVITDLNMPVMDGFDLIRTIRDNSSLTVFLVVLTDATDKDSLVRALSLGANDFLTKPVFHPELSLRIRNGLHLLRLETQDELIFSLAKLADCRSPETGNHLERVRIFTRLLGKQLITTCPELGMTESMAMEISRFSPLHDIGKVAIADGILNKPGKLTPDEFTIMKEHARIGGDLIGKIYRKSGSRSLRLAYDLTMHHHERWDGTGYPIGLSGPDIPVAARIMALSDVYDALTSERVYKRAFSREEAKSIILSSAGTHFDPVLVAAFELVEDTFHQMREELQDI